MKTCKKCNKELDSNQFYIHSYSKDGLTSWCKECISSDRKRITKEKSNGTYISKVRQPRLTEADILLRDKELKKYHSDYRENNKTKIARVKKEYVDNLKSKGINAYGGKCSCCGESIHEFLTIEHLEGRDSSEKRLTGKKMWAKAKAEGYPDRYTVLCFNCNCAKGAFGICPHQKNLIITNSCP